MAALAKLQTLTNDQAQLDALRAEIEAAMQPAEEEAAAEPVMEELTADDIPTLEVEVEEAPNEVAEAPVVAPPAFEVAAVEEPPVIAAKLPVVEAPPVVAHAPAKAQPAAAVPQPEPEPEPGVLKEFVSDLETSLGDGFARDAAAKTVPPAAPATRPTARPAAPAAHAEPEVAAEESVPVLGEFVADIEASLGDDFLKGAPVAAQQPVAPIAPVSPVAKAAPKPVPPAPVPVVAPPVKAPAVAAAVVEAPRVAPPMAASAAASAAPHAAPPVPQSAPMMSAPAATGSVAWQAPAVSAPKPQPPASPISHAPTPRGAAKASPFGDDAGVDLAEMFGELKQDLEADVASSDEDPETHYNLGIAFREMGLLDEAIGELQKACQSFDRGKPFPQIMQTYTWLAQCFLEKGVPEAAVRWYDKALNVPGIDSETRVALHYELASAYETAGDKPSALHHFMDVYGNNIDYRDVAERIKALKS